VITAPSNVDLAPGVYTLPGSTYLLVVDSPGAHLRAPASGPPSLLDLIPPASTTPAAPPTAPVTSPGGTPTWLTVLAAVLVGAVGYLLYERGVSPPAPIPAPVPGPVVPPGPAPTPAPKKPDWMGGLESKLDALTVAMQRPSAPATPPAPDFGPLLAKLDQITAKLETPREAQVSSMPGQVAPAPAVYYTSPQPRILTWYNGQWCTTGQCR